MSDILSVLYQNVNFMSGGVLRSLRMRGVCSVRVVVVCTAAVVIVVPGIFVSRESLCVGNIYLTTATAFILQLLDLTSV